jgi:hypothetical protein
MLGLAAACLALASPVITSERLDLRSAVLSRLPSSGSPVFVRDELQSAVEDLEKLEYVPQTAEFLRLGITGTWAVRALTEPTHESALVAFEMRTAELDLLHVEQTIAGNGQTLSMAEFELPNEDLRGKLEYSGMVTLTPMVDSVDLRSQPPRLRLPRAPASMDVPKLMQVLHARLSPEFRTEDGVRLGLQTTYMDEELRITRCTTGALRGECIVHVRSSS